MKRLGLILLLLAACCGKVSAASCSSTSLGNGITCVQSTNATTTASVKVVSKVFASNVTAGNLIIAVIGIGPQTGSPGDHPCSDSLGDTFYLLTSGLNFNGTVNDYVVCEAPNILGGADTVTFTNPYNAALTMAIHEYSGLSVASPFDVGSTLGQAGTSPTSNNMVTTHAVELIFSGAYDNSNTSNSYTPAAGFNAREVVSNAAGGNMATFDKTVASTGTYANAMTSTGSGSITVSIEGFATSVSAQRQCNNSSVGGGITCVQATKAWNVNSLALSLTQTNSASHFLIYQAIAISSGSNTLAVTDSNGNTITLLDSIGLTHGTAAWYLVQKSHAGSNTVTATTGSTVGTRISLTSIEYSGIFPINPVVAHAALLTAGTSESTPTIVSGGGLILTGLINPDNGGPSPYLATSGYSTESDNISLNNSNPQAMSVADQYLSAGTYSATWSGATGKLIAMIVSLAPSGVRHKAVVY